MALAPIGPARSLPPLHPAPRESRRRTAGPTPLGALLVARGALAPGDLAKALALQAREQARLGDILLAHGMVSEAELYAALAERWDARLVDLAAEPPDPRLIDAVGVETCLRHRFVPWRRVGGGTVIATARPEEFRRRAADLPAGLGRALIAIAPEGDVLDALVALRSHHMVRRAETRAPEAESCRLWDGRVFRRRLLAGLAGLAAAAVAAPAATVAVLSAAALLVLAANTLLRAAVLVRLRRAAATPAAPRPPRPAIARLPVVSLLVPLFHETAIAERLMARLGAISYPRELLDLCLVTEDSDATTRATLARTRLPSWARVVTVPEGTLRTKPRALNYALDFCRGSIVGIYDAEDAPASDQIHRVVRRFHERGPDVACLQGQLDFYNSRANWMARCFTLEYATWFRLVLPGLEALGFAIPLGGTTLFFRREALEALGGWDAHNVTEDADLGMRLARHGYRAELIETVTAEEANARPWAWVRQRSRWIKGYAMTWAVHMRDPRRLWRELGPWRFLGAQLLFGGSLLGAALAPVLWSFWLIVAGLPHPLAAMLPPAGLWLLGVSMAAAWAVNFACVWIATGAAEHRRLRPWALTLGPYFALATIASAKAFAEMALRPFYWDKTCHGLDTAPPAPDAVAPGPARAPVSAPGYRPARAPVIGEPMISRVPPALSRRA